ncbi:MAG: PKD domain-containing protein, partial [Chitinophagales bacterium]|nr:PKD domain-containing protein [Chitinophagales bacterium]MDW8428827.1 PKD domain-containing protein [Chitinophagales bacterium]
SWSNGSTSDIATITSPGTYTVTVTGPNGCTATDVHTVVCACGAPCPTCVDGGPCDTNGNLQTPVTLNAPASGTSYLWNTGATTSSISVSQPGIYTVTVTNSNNQACQSIPYGFYVHCTADVCPFSSSGSTCTANPPTVSQGANCNQFTFTANTDCSGTPAWGFGDGQGASGTTVTHTFTQAGVYQVCYQLGGTGPCDPPTGACTTVTVPVAADFISYVNCNTVSFTQLATVLSPATISSYSWSFGDPSNSTSTAQNPTFTYPGGGTYNVALTVTTNSGCTATVTKPVTLAGPNVTATIASSACNQPVNFSASASSNVPITGWLWNFGDNQGSTIQNPQHTYNVPSCTTFNVAVTATDGNGCQATATGQITVCPPPPQFNLIYTSPGCGSVLLDAGSGYTSYQWYLNGNPISGATSQTYTATTSGTYSCEVTDNNGCLIGSNPANIVVNPLPALNITVSPVPICAGQPLTLSSGLAASAGYIIDWFDASNTLIGSGATLPLGPLTGGSYTYSATAIDPATNCTTQAPKTFTVHTPPTVSVTNSQPLGICAPATVTVTATANPSNVSYLWNTGQASSSITVASGGAYTVTVTDANGCTASATDVVVIHPLPDLSMLPIGCAKGCLPDTIHGPPGMAVYDWQINQVSVSNAQDLILTPALMPTLNVPYIITLIATTTNGCTDSTSFEYTPEPCPDSVKCFTIEDSLVCNPDGSYSLQLNVTNNHSSASAAIYLHDFTPGFTINGLPYYVQFLYVPSGGSSGWFPVPALTLSPGQADTFCFKALIIFGDTCCCDSICIPLPDCNPCENVSVSATPEAGNQQNAGCCAQIDITNNFIPNYFTGVQVVPVTPGASIGSVSLGSGGTGWFTSGTSAQMSFYPPTGFIPTGTINDLFTLCLNLQVNTPAPQIVLFNWLTNSSTNQDSIVCVDTLIFDCDAPQPNPCGEIEDTIICEQPGTYVYTFTLTNNSAFPVHTAIIDYLNPVSIGMPIIYFFNPALQPGQTSAPISVTLNTSLPPGTQVCYHMTLLDSIGCCCLSMDTVCFTLPDCPDSLCACGDWNTWQIAHSGLIETVTCGTLLMFSSGTTLNFTPANPPCQGGANCQPTVQWELYYGNTVTTGTGYPSFTVTGQGVYTLNIYGSCNGQPCPPCVFDMEVTGDPSCVCVGWEGPRFVSVGSTTYALNKCGATLNGYVGDVVQVSGFFLCQSNAGPCLADYNWQVTDAAANVISSGSGFPAFFSPPLPGFYTFTVIPVCGTTACDTCTINFNIFLPVDSCTCGQWGDFTVTTSEASYIYQACGSKYWSETKVPITLSGDYYCQGGSCSAMLSWVVRRNGVNYTSGSGMPISFTPVIAGNYTVGIMAMCNGQMCGRCRFQFKVTDGFAPQWPETAKPEVSETGRAALSMRLEPNPAFDHVKVTLESPGDDAGQLMLTNELGVVVLRTDLTLRTGINEYELRLPALGSGWYVVHFNGLNGRTFKQLIIAR